MKNKKIAIIGAGHMGQVIAKGLVRANTSISTLVLSSPHVKPNTSHLNTIYTNNNRSAIKNADFIFLCVKPKIVQSVVREIKDEIEKNTVIISTATGVTLEILSTYFSGSEPKLVRIMPNLPVAYGKGVIGVLFGKSVSELERKKIINLFSSLGEVILCLDEKQLDALTILSGSGPGIVGYFMQQLVRIAKKYGFSNDVSQKIVRQVFSGTATHLEKTHISIHDLVMSVATKGGITEEVLFRLDEEKFPSLFHKAIQNGYDKVMNISKELANGNV